MELKSNERLIAELLPSKRRKLLDRACPKTYNYLQIMLLQKFSIDYNGRFWAVCTKNGRYNFNFQNLCHKSAALGTGRRFTRRRRLVSKKK